MRSTRSAYVALISGVIAMGASAVLLYGTVRMVLDPATRSRVLHASHDPELIETLPLAVHELSLLGTVLYGLYGGVILYAGLRLHRDREWTPMPGTGS